METDQTGDAAADDEADKEMRGDGVDRDDRVDFRRDDADVERVDNADATLPLFGVKEGRFDDAEFFLFVPPECWLVVLKPLLMWCGNDFSTLLIAFSTSSGLTCLYDGKDLAAESIQPAMMSNPYCG